MWEWPRDGLKTPPLWCFTHKVERRVICVLARKQSRLPYQETISAMEEWKKTLSPLPNEQGRTLEYEWVREFVIPSLLNQGDGLKEQNWVRGKLGFRFSQHLCSPIFSHLSSPLVTNFYTLIRANWQLGGCPKNPYKIGVRLPTWLGMYLVITTQIHF